MADAVVRLTDRLHDRYRMGRLSASVFLGRGSRYSTFLVAFSGGESRT